MLSEELFVWDVSAIFSVPELASEFYFAGVLKCMDDVMLLDEIESCRKKNIPQNTFASFAQRTV